MHLEVVDADAGASPVQVPDAVFGNEAMQQIRICSKGCSQFKEAR